MKNKKIWKRILAGALSVTMVASVFLGTTIRDTMDVQADTRVFTKITDTYSPAGSTSGKVLKILEISTTDQVYHTMVDQNGPIRNINQNAEIGYFMPYSAKADDKVIAGYKAGNDQSSPQYLGETSLGGRYGHPSSGKDKVGYKNLVWRNNQWEKDGWTEENIVPAGSTAKQMYINLLTRLRDYGLVKPFATDNGWQTIVGEYPIYSKGAVFSQAKSDVTKEPMGSTLVPGVYTYAENGNYKLADGYKLNDACQICTVSMNTISQNGVPVEVPVYTPVDDISSIGAADFPKSSVTGEYYITAVNEGEGDLNFTETEAESTLQGRQQYYGYSKKDLWYAPPGVDFSRSKNSGWFLEYVLGSYKKYADTDLVYDVKYASTVKKEDVDNYDLIYISGTDAEFSAKTENDIKADVMKALYEKTINDHRAIIMDFDGYKKSSNTNVSKLAALLWQDSQDDLLTDSTEGESIPAVLTKDETTKKYTLNLDNLTDEVLTTLKKRMLSEDSSFLNRTDGNFVVGNVYVYDHHQKDFVNPKARIDAEDSFATGDFNTPYNSTVVSAGFNNVLKYIQSTNKNSMSGNMANEVTPAVVIQYILVSDGLPLTVLKNSLSVLEIEPSAAYLYNPSQGSYEYDDLDASVDEQKAIKDNRDKFIEDFLSERYNTKEMKKFISFTSMNVAEFNGKNDDLIENYDIIFIGAQTKRLTGANKGKSMYTMSTSKSLKWDATNKRYGTATGAAKDANIPSYEDENMLGNVYYNIGDYHTSLSENLSGHVKNDTSAAKGGVDLRFPGRDITRDKMNKLKNFLKADALVILDEEIYGHNKVNPTAVSGYDHGRVDNSSNLYEFVMYGAGKVWIESEGKYVENYDGVQAKKYPNMVSAADLRTSDATYKIDKSELNQYIAAQKLDLLISDKPNEYGYTTYSEAGKTSVIDPNTVSYMNNKGASGLRELKYVFSIGEDDTLVESIDSSINSQYICRLYIDINNDGKYSKTTEDISDILVVDSSGTEAARNTDNGDDHYLLSPGVEYTLTREVADDYTGILKWKLLVESKIQATVHASEEGYTMIKNETGKKKTVKILQINHNSGSTLNLQTALETERKNMQNAKNGGAVTHDQWGKFLYDVPDYNLEIKTVTVNDFQTDFINQYTGKETNPTKLGLKQFAKQYFAKYEIKAATATEAKVTGVNMIVLGFGDNYASFTDERAMGAIRSFIELGNPTLLTHDFIMYQATNKQVRLLRNVVGMDKYGSSQRLVQAGSPSGTGNDAITYLFTNRYDDAGSELTVGFDYLFAGNPLTRTTAADKTKIAAIEGTTKEVAYLPGSERGTLVRDTQGLSYAIIERYSNNNTGAKKQTYFSLEGASTAAQQSTNGTDDFKTANILKQNDGQITHYPYILPDTFKVNTTHSQYYQLDMTSDNDNDGESDVVVWYAFGSTLSGSSKATAKGSNRYDDEYGYSTDPANGYYIYNKGNVTYTGAGHSSLTNAGDFEVQLFVNTLLATFEVGNVEPDINFYDKTDANATPISSIVVPYDEVITKPEPGQPGVDSSVLKDDAGQYRYKFVDPNTNAAVSKQDGTVAYFKIDDKNLVRGTKSIAIRYFLKTEEEAGTKIKTNNNIEKEVQTIDIGEDQSFNAIDISDLIETYRVTNNAIHADALPRDGKTEDGQEVVDDIESSKLYAIYLPMDYLNDQASFSIYLEAQTTVTSVTTSGDELVNTTKKVYKPLTIVKADLLELD